MLNLVSPRPLLFALYPHLSTHPFILSFEQRPLAHGRPTQAPGRSERAEGRQAAGEPDDWAPPRTIRCFGSNQARLPSLLPPLSPLLRSSPVPGGETAAVARGLGPGERRALRLLRPRRPLLPLAPAARTSWKAWGPPSCSAPATPPGTAPPLHQAPPPFPESGGRPPTASGPAPFMPRPDLPARPLPRAPPPTASPRPPQPCSAPAQAPPPTRPHPLQGPAPLRPGTRPRRAERPGAVEPGETRGRGAVSSSRRRWWAWFQVGSGQRPYWRGPVQPPAPLGRGLCELPARERGVAGVRAGLRLSRAHRPRG